jgi:hypothetical protein
MFVGVVQTIYGEIESNVFLEHILKKNGLY